MAAAILILTSWGCKQKEPERERAAEGDPARAQLMSFWQLYGEATRLRIAGELTQAVEVYRQALDNNPHHEDSLYYLANCLAESGEIRQAIEGYEKLLQEDPRSHRGYFQLGIMLSTPVPGASLDFSRARQAFQRNLEINREESGPFLRLGELALIEGNSEEARKYFDIAAGFQSPEGTFRAGFVRYLEGDYRDALPFFSKVLEMNEHERKLSGRGVRSEGDVQRAEGQLTPGERAGIQALVYLYWTSRNLGGYDRDIPPGWRISPPAPQGKLFEFELLRSTPTGKGAPEILSIRDLWTEDWRGAGAGAAVRRREADLDGDGIPERVEGGNGGIRIVGRGNAAKAVGGPRPVVDLDIFDFDGDGRRDILALRWKRGMALYRNTPAGFEDVTAAAGLPEGGDEAYALATLDFDRDGRPDILIAPYPGYADVLAHLARPGAPASTHAMRLFRNIGKGRFEELHNFPGLEEVHSVVRIVPADFDGDQFPDLLLACGGVDVFRLEPSLVLRNEEGKAFTVAAYLPGFDTPMRALGAEILGTDILIRGLTTLIYRNRSR